METRETQSSMMTQTPDRAGQQAARVRDAVMALELLACATSMHVGGANDHTAKAFREFFRAAGEALAAGVPPARLLAELGRDPDDDPPSPAPAPPPWAEYLPMSLDAFEASGAALRIFVRPWMQAVWLAGEAGGATLRASGVWAPLVKGTGWMVAELDEAGVPAAERTVGRLLEVLHARVEELRKDRMAGAGGAA